MNKHKGYVSIVKLRRKLRYFKEEGLTYQEDARIECFDKLVNKLCSRQKK